jgi:hypothetical protein
VIRVILGRRAPPRARRLLSLDSSLLLLGTVGKALCRVHAPIPLDAILPNALLIPPPLASSPLHSSLAGPLESTENTAVQPAMQN